MRLSSSVVFRAILLLLICCWKCDEASAVVNGAECGSSLCDRDHLECERWSAGIGLLDVWAGVSAFTEGFFR